MEDVKATENEEEEFEDCTLEVPVECGDTVTQKLSLLDKKISGRHGIEWRLEELEAQLADLTSEYCEIKAENKKLKEEATILRSVVIKQDKEIAELKRKQVDQTSRSMRDNLLLHNVPEKEKENTEKEFRRFLSKKLNMENVDTIKLDRVHRVGPQREDGTARPIVAKFSFFKQKMEVLRRWKRVGEVPQGNPKLTSQLPPETIAKRSQSFHVVEKMKKSCREGENLDVKIKAEKVYVNKELITAKVARPTAEDILNFPEDDKEKARKLPHKISRIHTERGSTFQGVTYSTKSLNDVRLAYNGVFQDPARAKATHNILVYKVGHDSGWEDDGEYGAGKFLNKWLEDSHLDNICVIVTRQYGGDKLGTKRFELMKTVAKESYGQLKQTM